MATNKATKPQATVTPSINAGKLTFVPGKARADHNAKRAKAVNGMSMAQAITHYATLGFKKVDLNYDIFKIKSLSTS
jgi:hypothetical protein